MARSILLTLMLVLAGCAAQAPPVATDAGVALPALEPGARVRLGQALARRG